MSFEKDVKASCSSSVNSTSSVAEAFFASLGVGRLPAQSPMMAAKSLDLPVPLGAWMTLSRSLRGPNSTEVSKLRQLATARL